MLLDSVNAPPSHWGSQPTMDSLSTSFLTPTTLDCYLFYPDLLCHFSPGPLDYSVVPDRLNFLKLSPAHAISILC